MMAATILARAALVLAGLTGLAQAADAPLFTCAMRRGSVSVTELGGTLALRLRLPGKPDTVVAGDAGHRTVLSFQDLYAGQERQLRFIDGGRSYIVYTMAGNRQTGAQAVSGLSVALGRKLTLDQPCSHYIEFADAWQAVPAGGFDRILGHAVSTLGGARGQPATVVAPGTPPGRDLRTAAPTALPINRDPSGKPPTTIVRLERPAQMDVQA